MARWTDETKPIVQTVADLGFDGVEVSLLGMSDDIGPMVWDNEGSILILNSSVTDRNI